MDNLPNLAQWSLDTIRKEGTSFSWLEERRFDWSNPLSLALEQIINGKTIILIGDDKRKWLETYIVSNINSANMQRPLLPIVSIDSLYSHYGDVEGGEMIDIVEDMLSLSYKENYFFWYIGSGDSKRADIAKRRDNSYFWIFDEEFHNGFTLKSYDKNLDIKLLQLYKLFDASLDVAMFGEVDVSS